MTPMNESTIRLATRVFGQQYYDTLATQVAKPGLTRGRRGHFNDLSFQDEEDVTTHRHKEKLIPTDSEAVAKAQYNTLIKKAYVPGAEVYTDAPSYQPADEIIPALQDKRNRTPESRGRPF
ncbi:hypothetical protein BC936DRAFT_149357 [Jimgerdemannia flammicorona]|uniref:Uncharacterized protein n=1 Tax=Jimgerdemannia flammicorona TaxID=994334 RepID=A0A433D0Z6_9FUNG|nr:hypothetical protein BC936DRAFT_149357 [Jimgerdemannia flammicorona]